MAKRIAFIGSSGGNLYKQGGNNLSGMMKEILLQTEAAEMQVTYVQYVMASGSLDTVGEDSRRCCIRGMDQRHRKNFQEP